MDEIKRILRDICDEFKVSPDLTWKQCVDRNCVNGEMAEFLYCLGESIFFHPTSDLVKWIYS